MHDIEGQSNMSAAEALLGRMKASGVEILFANGGTDFPSIVDALARSSETGIAMPEAVAIPHEAVAVGMAHGCYLMTGKPAAVMVHVNVGLANGVMGLLNPAAERVPILMCSGRTPITETGRLGSRSVPIHWGQEMRDQGAMVRESVKWDYELRYPEQAAAAVDRALAVAMSVPSGSRTGRRCPPPSPVRLTPRARDSRRCWRSWSHTEMPADRGQLRCLLTAGPTAPGPVQRGVPVSSATAPQAPSFSRRQ